MIADGEITAEEGVRAYHGVLQRLGVKPQRSLEADLTLQTNVMHYAGNGVVVSAPPGKDEAKSGACACHVTAGTCACNGAAKASENGAVDFTKMTAAQKMAYHKAKWDRILG